jgi:hypothetical protein
MVDLTLPPSLLAVRHVLPALPLKTGVQQHFGHLTHWQLTSKALQHFLSPRPPFCRLLCPPTSTMSCTIPNSCHHTFILLIFYATAIFLTHDIKVHSHLPQTLNNSLITPSYLQLSQPDISLTIH